jgi:hypothetical protein
MPASLTERDGRLYAVVLPPVELQMVMLEEVVVYVNARGWVEEDLLCVIFFFVLFLFLEYRVHLLAVGQCA